MKINPAASIYRPQPVKRDKPGLRELPMAPEVTEEEIRQQEIEDAIFGAKSLFGQALLCLTIIFLLANIVNQVIKLCF